MRFSKLGFFLALMTGLATHSTSASASVTVSIGTNLTYEHTSEGRSMESRQPISLRAGWRTGPHNLSLEFTEYTTSSGVQILQIERKHREWIGWYRHELGPWRLRPYVAGGVGIQYDVVRTDFAEETSRDAGSPTLLGAAAGGARYAFTRNLEVLAEVKLAMSPTYAPNPMFGAGAHLGFSF
jgi:hypothetical protein